MTKEESQFIEWEERVFGAGYGTGELPIMETIKVFFDNLKDDGRMYDFEILEEKLGKPITWLLINAFNKGNVIEWGTSARFGWLSPCGEYVRDFVKDKNPEELYEILMQDCEDYLLCRCDGKLDGHNDCGKNPMVNEKIAEELKYKKDI